MKIIEIFKTDSEDDRREAITEILIKYEEDKCKESAVRELRATG